MVVCPRSVALRGRGEPSTAAGGFEKKSAHHTTMRRQLRENLVIIAAGDRLNTACVDADQDGIRDGFATAQAPTEIRRARKRPKSRTTTSTQRITRGFTPLKNGISGGRNLRGSSNPRDVLPPGPGMAIDRPPARRSVPKRSAGPKFSGPRPL